MNPASITILLIEDTDALREMCETFLRAEGFQVFAAGNAEDACYVWKEQSRDINLLLTDISLCDSLSGEAVDRLFRQEKPKLKTIFMSGYEIGHVVAEVSLIEGRNFLTKPFTRKMLLDTVRAALS